MVWSPTKDFRREVAKEDLGIDPTWKDDDDCEGPGPIISRRPWQPGTLMSKISRTVQGGKEVVRNVSKGRRTLDMMMKHWPLDLRSVVGILRELIITCFHYNANNKFPVEHFI
jgi:hypothetical protein